MRTVKALRDAGFQVQPATDAVDCTEVLSKEICWHYNPKFAASMPEVVEALQAFTFAANGYRLLVAGHFADDDVFPLNIIDQPRKELLDGARARWITARNEGQRAHDDFMDALRTDQAYAD